MINNINPSKYNAWYQTDKGKWITNIEFNLLMKLLHPETTQSLLDVGCGTGQFSQRFSKIGLQVTGVDHDLAMLDYAKSIDQQINYIQAGAEKLPFNDETFDYCSAVTSLCFIQEPQQALQEMWRVSKKGIVLGLLNRFSLLYLLKRNNQGYKGARWDTPASIYQWCDKIKLNTDISIRTAIWCPLNFRTCPLLEKVIPDKLNYGGFIAIYLKKN